MRLTRAQRRFLALHAATPAPHRWAWLGPTGSGLARRPEDAERLRAWRHSGFGWTFQATISREELRYLDRYFDPFPRVSEAGRLVLGGFSA